MTNGPLVLTPLPPKWEGGHDKCGLVACSKSFVCRQQIVVLRRRDGDTFVFCSAECMNAGASGVNLVAIAACELWTYFPRMGTGALVSQRTKREQARSRRLKKGIRGRR